MRLFSIIIAVYNVEKYLGECLESIIGQKYTNWEVILVDDGSIDNSATICDEYAIKDKRIRVFHQENKGSLMARRFGIHQAEGDYFLFIDSDDLLNLDLLKEVDQIIENTGSDLVIYRFQRFGDLKKIESPIVFQEGTIVGEDGRSKKLIWNKVISCCELNNLCLKVVKRECIDFESDYEKYAFLKFGTDLLQSLPILDRADKIYFTEKVYYYYRYNEDGISIKKTRSTDIENVKALLRTRRTLFKRIEYYLKKNSFDSEENLQTLYIYYFRSKISALITWIINEKEIKMKRSIIQLVMKEDNFFNEGTKYIEISNIPTEYRRLYRLYIGKKERRFAITIYMKAGVKKVMELGIGGERVIRGLIKKR